MRDMILSSSVLIIAIMAIRTFAEGKISAKMQYALWLLVMVRLIVPGTIGSSPISVQRLAQFSTRTTSEAGAADVTAVDMDPQTIDSIMADMNAGISAYLGGNTEKIADKNADMDANGNIPGNADAGAEINDGINVGADAFGNVADNADRASQDSHSVNAAPNMETNLFLALTWKNVICGIWILGIVITGGYMLLYQIRFAKYLAAHRKPLQEKKGQYRGLEAYTVEGLPSPCLCGKRIYLDGEMAVDERKLNHVLAHEYCHYRQLDPFWAVVRCILVSVYWFHPLVWAAAYASKQDSELACDEAAITLLGEEERYAYGRTLLGLVCKKSSGGPGIGPALTMGSSEKGIRERIGRIAKRRRPLIIAVSLVLVLTAVIAVITFTGTRQETEQESSAVTAPESDESLDGTDLADIKEEMEALEELKLRLAEEMETLEEEKRRLAEMVQTIAEEEARQNAEVMAVQEAQAMQESADVIALLSTYDEVLLPVKGEGREGEIRELPGAIIRQPSDLWEKYHSQGEDAIVEGLYLLASWNGREGQSMPQSVNAELEDIISVYGLYTKEYGLRGVKTVVGEDADKDVNNFDIIWSFVGNSRVHVLGTDPEDAAPDGLPRTFAFIQLVPGSEEAYMDYGPEAYELYLCDRYDTGHIEMSKVSNGEFILQIQDRISINYEEKKLYVYDSGMLVAMLDPPHFSVSDSESVKAVIDTDYIDFTFDSYLGNIRLDVPVELQIESEDKNVRAWFPSLPVITFPIDCGYFGPDREFTLERARMSTFNMVSRRHIEL